MWLTRQKDWPGQQSFLSKQALANRLRTQTKSLHVAKAHLQGVHSLTQHRHVTQHERDKLANKLQVTL